MKISAALGTALAGILVAGCAVVGHERNATHSEVLEPVPKSMKSGPETKTLQVPALVVRINCSDCEVRPAVPELIRDSYAQAAVKSGARVASEPEATLTITTYSDRGIRRFLGPLSMMQADEIKATVSVGGQEFAIEQSARIPFRSIESVARKIGEMAFEGMAKAQSATISNR